MQRGMIIAPIKVHSREHREGPLAVYIAWYTVPKFMTAQPQAKQHNKNSMHIQLASVATQKNQESIPNTQPQAQPSMAASGRPQDAL